MVVVPNQSITLQLTNVHGVTFPHIFPPDTLLIEEIGETDGKLLSFLIGDNHYILKEYNQDSNDNDIISNLKKLAKYATKDVSDLKIYQNGAKYGFQGGSMKSPKYGIIGIILGLSAAELLVHIKHSQKDGYYCNGKFYFEGPKYLEKV